MQETNSRRSLQLYQTLFYIIHTGVTWVLTSSILTAFRVELSDITIFPWTTI